MEKTIDCIVCGTCTVDIMVKPFPVDSAIGKGKLIRVDPIEATTGGIVANSGMTLARLGMRVSAFTYVGDDELATIVKDKHQAEGIDISGLIAHPTAPTSATAVCVDAGGERSFAHHPGAPTLMDRAMFLDRLDMFSASRMALIGYYSLLPSLEEDLPDVLAKIRETGCLTALDAAGDGGGLQPLDRALPHLDVYVPSFLEANHQTGEEEPEKIIEVYRGCGAEGLLGVKLGTKGILLSPKPGEFVSIPTVPPPGPVLDTTGAGDAFYAGLVCGLLRGMEAEQAGRLGAAAGACCVAGLGASAGLRDFEETARLAGIG